MFSVLVQVLRTFDLTNFRNIWRTSPAPGDIVDVGWWNLCSSLEGLSHMISAKQQNKSSTTEPTCAVHS